MAEQRDPRVDPMRADMLVQYVGDTELGVYVIGTSPGYVHHYVEGVSRYMTVPMDSWREITANAKVLHAAKWAS